jgi:uncharacterized protein (UPF0333 family)
MLIASRARRDRGSLSIELAILLPGFILMALLATMFGRETLAQSAIDLAAHDAARAATVARDYPDAVIAATNAAKATLNLASTHCTGLVVDVLPKPPNTAYAVPIGLPSNVTVKITCSVPLADLSPLPLPSGVTMTAQFASPLDQYRGRI